MVTARPLLSAPRVLAGLVCLAALTPALAHATPFTPIGAPTTAKQRHISIEATSVVSTARIPGSAGTLHIVALSHDRTRFQVARSTANGIDAYGDGVSIRVAERAHHQYFLTAVSFSGAQRVRITYTMKGAP